MTCDAGLLQVVVFALFLFLCYSYTSQSTNAMIGKIFSYVSLEYSEYRIRNFESFIFA